MYQQVLPMIFDLTTSGLCVYWSFKLQREAGDLASSLLRNFTKHGTLYAVGAAVAVGEVPNSDKCMMLKLCLYVDALLQNISNLAFMAM